MTDQKKIRAILTALAVGDATGMPTEFLTRNQIRERFSPFVPGLIAPDSSSNHPNLPFAAVTDDTEQNLYLYRLYRRTGRVDARETADCLLKWADETGAAEKRYIGPSSRAALDGIRAGLPVEEAGTHGTTCGGVMRAPSAVLWRDHLSEDELADDIHRCLLCTHHTSQALEAAGAYGFALRAALCGGGMDEIVQAAERGAERLIQSAPFIACAPSSVARIRAFVPLASSLTPEQLLDELYFVYGTGLPSADVCGAAFAVFFAAEGDVWKAIRMGASVGGDTDTIAALAGALSAAYAGEHNIPADIVGAVFAQNPILRGDPWEEPA